MRTCPAKKSFFTRTRSPRLKRSGPGRFERPGALGSESGKVPLASFSNSSRVTTPFSTHSVARLVSDRS